MTIDRRALLKAGGLTGLASVLPSCSRPERESSVPASAPQSAAEYTIRIGTRLVELAPDRIVATTLYDKQFPGPLIRLKEGRPAGGVVKDVAMLNGYQVMEVDFTAGATGLSLRLSLF